LLAAAENYQPWVDSRPLSATENHNYFNSKIEAKFLKDTRNDYHGLFLKNKN
jgi:hypothetical protein